VKLVGHPRLPHSPGAASSLRSAARPEPERAPFPALAPSGSGRSFAQTPARAASGPPPQRHPRRALRVTQAAKRQRQPSRHSAQVAAPTAGHPMSGGCAPPGLRPLQGIESKMVQRSSHPPELRPFNVAVGNRTSSVICACRTRSAHSDTGAKKRRRSRAGKKSVRRHQCSLRGRVPLHFIARSSGESQCSRRRRLRCRRLATLCPRRVRGVAVLVVGSSRIAFRMG